MVGKKRAPTEKVVEQNSVETETEEIVKEQRPTRSTSNVAKKDIPNILEDEDPSEEHDELSDEEFSPEPVKKPKVTKKRNANETQESRNEKNLLAKGKRQAKKKADINAQATQVGLFEKHLLNQAREERFEEGTKAQNELISNEVTAKLAETQRKNTELEKENSVLNAKLLDRDSEIKKLQDEIGSLTSTKSDLQERLKASNEKVLSMSKYIEKEKHFQKIANEEGIMVVDAQGFSDVFNKLPGIVQQLQDLANNPGSRYNPQPNNDAFEMSILDDDPQNVEVEPDSGLGSLVFPSDMNEKWKIFDERVAQLRSKPDDEFKYALVHTENGANLYDLGKPFEQEGVFFASKTLLARAVNNSKEVHSYAVQALEAFFRHDVAFFCTCTGSSKGQSPDGHARAGLPDKPLQIFIAHCIRLARKKSWKLQKTDKDTRTFLVRKINIFLNNQRHNYGFDPTEEQLKEYNKKMGRGSEFAKKRKNNPSAEEELEEDIL